MTQQLILDILPPSPKTLDNFIAGENHATLDALRHCQAGRAIYLWGPPGAGRSHLLHAVSGMANAIYFGANQDESELQELATADSIGYRLIAIDDVERLNSQQQAALFSLYNRWRESASSKNAFILIVAGDRAPMAMPLREDLRTRLGWDLSFRVHLLSDDDRAQAMRMRAHDRGLKLAPEVINWLLTHYTRDMSRLGSLVDALDRYSLERHRPITLPLLKELLASSQAPISDTNTP